MAHLEGNCLIVQSGSPTPVVNACVAGIVTEALNHEEIEEIYGCRNGFYGLLEEDFIDLASESQQTIRLMETTPGAVLGSCRFRLKNLQETERIIAVLKAHNIRYLFLIGDHDTMAAAARLKDAASSRELDISIIAVPKTIDNDLPSTDHSPGYGSTAKYIATTVKELACDHEAMGQKDLVSIIEVLGRNAGWVAAAATLAKRRDQPNDPPHLIYLPEVAFSEEKFIEDVRRILRRENYAMVVVGEGLVDSDGNYVGNVASQADNYGFVKLGGAGEKLCELVENKLGLRSRLCRPGLSQRASSLHISKTDQQEAREAGRYAVRKALEGETGKMVLLLRGESDTYSCEFGLTDVGGTEGQIKRLPVDWIHEDGCSLNHQFLKYAHPLIQGEVILPHENGLPVFARLSNVEVEKQLPAYEY